MASQFWKGVWAEFTGSAQHRRDFLRIKEIVLRDVSARIRRLPQPKSMTTPVGYDTGYADAVDDILKMIDPDLPKDEEE